MEGVPTQEESFFDKKTADTEVDAAVSKMFDRYGDNIPDAIQELGEEILGTMNAIARNPRVTTREELIGALDFSKNGGKLSEQAYQFIVEKI